MIGKQFVLKKNTDIGEITGWLPPGQGKEQFQIVFGEYSGMIDAGIFNAIFEDYKKPELKPVETIKVEGKPHKKAVKNV